MKLRQVQLLQMQPPVQPPAQPDIQPQKAVFLCRVPENLGAAPSKIATNATTETVLMVLTGAKGSSVLVLDKDSGLAGIVTEQDIMRKLVDRNPAAMLPFLSLRSWRRRSGLSGATTGCSTPSRGCAGPNCATCRLSTPTAAQSGCLILMRSCRRDPRGDCIGRPADPRRHLRGHARDASRADPNWHPPPGQRGPCLRPVQWCW